MQCDNIINTLAPCLVQSGWNGDLANFISIFLGVVLVATFPLLVTIGLIWFERKFAARIQDRMGPNRVGPFGLLQPFADVIKLLGKENITPAGADKVIYNIAPPLMVMSVLLIWAVIPLTPIHVGMDLEIGALYFVSVASFGTLAVIFASWSSNNKYALLGAFRVVAQLISYEIPLAFALLVPVLLAGSMSLVDITNAQAGMWFVFMAPLSALLFFVSSQAETGRGPFDLLEAESELVAGFNIEYSGMKFALFFAGEFMHVFTNGVLMAVLFTGGYIGIGGIENSIPLLGLVFLLLKAFVWYLLALLVRNALPRVRIDQLMNFNWKFLVPVSIVNLVMMAFLFKVVQELGLAPAPGLENDFVANIPQTLVLFAGNVVLGLLILSVVRQNFRRERLEESAKSAIVPVGAGD
ncbi:MAG: NADH-quinone oxidoreductase subunit NuoH [Anaerolineae bacterium]|jgi:NADH-quinone oxidoreductase subunit H|nr:NADH-quinone oxidoreductase subunit NuoH [Anaerolineae bacterium]